jgi:hydroxypyruvate isomerase
LIPKHISPVNPARREFLAGAAAAMAVGLVSATASAAEPQGRFKLHYAPHPGMFRNSGGNSIVDQIKFSADQGFSAWEDNGMKGRPASEQEQIGKTLADLKMKMGVFVAHGSIGRLTFAKKDAEAWKNVLNDIRGSVDVAKRVNAKWMTVVPGNMDEGGGSRLAEGYQTANVIELLRRCCEILEPHGLVMVLEPLNWYANHGGVFLRYADQAYAICKAVNSPSCKILFDIYHQQITEGNLIPNIDRCWDEIAYFQSGDNPGRREPGTGEINYRNVFKHIAGKSRDLIIGMEHGNSKPGVEGEKAVVQAYRDADAF